MCAGSFIKICLQRKVAAAIASAVSIFRPLNKLRTVNNTDRLIDLYIPNKYIVLKEFNG